MKELYDLDSKSNQELVDIILNWAPKAPKEFDLSFTMNIHRLLLSGCSLTPRQRLGLMNVIIGWIVHPKNTGLDLDMMKAEDSYGDR